MKTMFPREFVIWKDRNTAIIFIRDGKVGHWYGYAGVYYSIDNLYRYWRLKIEPKNKEK
jgi:hypothetical protein